MVNKEAKLRQKIPNRVPALRLALAGTVLFACFSFLPLIRSNPRLAASFWGATAALALFILVVRHVAAGRMLRYEFRPRPVHYVQLAMHTSIYAYWGWYWREVYHYAPLIVAQIVLPVQHCLISRWKRSQIKKLYSHPQSLGQCRGWVQTNLPRAEIIETSSNARSAEFASKEKESGAIAGVLAAEKYRVPIVEHDIQDNAANATRFLVLGRQCSPPTGNDRTSVMFSIMDRVGALYRALAPFRRFRINMTKIESRPSKRKAWEYFFFVDCDGHMNDKKVAKAIALLSEQCSYVKVLGSYPNSE
jgi:prephenate dehydratase